MLESVKLLREIQDGVNCGVAVYLLKRFRISKEIIEAKIMNGKSPYDENRESEIINSVLQLAQTPEEKAFLVSAFKAIFFETHRIMNCRAGNKMF